jgi:hypothetical protein
LTEQKGKMKKTAAPEKAIPLEAQTIQVDDKVYSAKGLADSHPGQVADVCFLIFLISSC